MTRRVMFATPSHSGRLSMWFSNAMRHTEKLLAANDIEALPIYAPGDALVQRARNFLHRIFLRDGYDDLFWVDDDIEWSPQAALALLLHDVDVVGCAYRKKTDDEEIYTVRVAKLPIPADIRTRLWLVDGLGTGFLRMSRLAAQALWDATSVDMEYDSDGEVYRWIYDVYPVGRRLISEDNIACEKLKQLGFAIHLDPNFVPFHIGEKKYGGDFKAYIAKLEARNRAA